MEEQNVEEKAKKTAQNTARNVSKKASKLSKDVLKKLLRNPVTRKILIGVVIASIVLIILISALRVILLADTAGEGEGENRTKAKVPAAAQEIVQATGVSTTIKSTSSSAGSNTSSNSGNNMIVSYSESGDGYSSITEVDGKTYRNYKQYEGSYAGNPFGYGTISDSGCGPTSVTIVLSGYKLDYSPGEVVQRMSSEVAKSSNSFRLSDLLNLYEIDNERKTYESFSTIVNDIRENLSAGRPVLVGIEGTPDGTYSYGDHWVVILGEKDGHIIVSNPGRSDSSTPTDDTLENFIQSQMSPDCGYVLIKEELDSTSNSNTYISDKIVEAAVECHKYVREHGYTYGGGYEIPEGIYSHNVIDCSAYVSWVYYTAGYDSFKGPQERDIVANASKHGLVEVPISEAQPGDIIHEPGHVEIVAEVIDGKITRVYNCGDDDYIIDPGTPELPESTPDYGGADHVYRPKEASTSKNPIEGSSSVSSITIAEDKIFFIGDSWMEGLNSSGKAKSSSSYFYAKGSQNADWVLSNYNDMKTKMPKDISCIVVEFGLNGLTNWSKTQELVNKLVNDYPEKEIYVIQTPHICDGYTAVPNFNSQVDQYNENMKKYCSEKMGVTFIDPTTNIVSDSGKGYLKPEYASDANDTSMGGGKLHLNANGYEVWYKDIVSLIQSNTSEIDSSSNTGSTGVASSTNVSGHIVENGRGGYKVDIDLDSKVEELIQKLDEDGSNPLRNYLSDENREEYLKTFLQAAIVTSYPDLRQKSEIGNDVPEGEVQGIIRIRRKRVDTPESNEGDYLQYIPQNLYNELKEENNDNIYNCFTIDNSGQIVVAGYELREVRTTRS